ncbi:19277_t:CDS:2, partial [Gigaspora margarita]
MPESQATGDEKESKQSTEESFEESSEESSDDSYCEEYENNGHRKRKGGIIFKN